MSTESATWNLLNAVRGESAGASAVESLVVPLALLLALRWADEYDSEHAAIAEFNGEEPRAILPPTLSWSTWRENPHPFSSQEVSTLWGGIRSVLGLSPDPRSTHCDVRLPTGKLLAATIDWADQFPLDTPIARRQAGEAFTELVTRAMDLAQFGGELVTPRAMGQMMVALAAPQPGERIYDPCFGMGGLLVEAAQTLWWRGRDISPGEWTLAQSVPVFGVERQAALHLVAFVRLLLAGVRPALELGDALEREAAGRHHDQGFDCVVVDPPWGSKLGGDQLYEFPIQGRVSESLFLQHAVRSLRPGGRAVVAVPPTLLERSSDYELRQWLLVNYRLELVIRLPASKTGPAIKRCLLVVRCGPPSDTVRFVDIETLPELEQDSRSLANALVAGENVAPHKVQSVPVQDLLKADARLSPPQTLSPAIRKLLQECRQRTEVLPLGEVAEIIASRHIPAAIVSDHGNDGAIPLIRASDLRDTTGEARPAFIPESEIAKIPQRQLVVPGDLLVATVGSIGSSLLIGNRTAPSTEAGSSRPQIVAVAHSSVVIVRPKRLLDVRFLQAVLRSEMLQAQLRAQAGRLGSTFRIVTTELQQLPMPVPPPAVQKRVLQRLADRPGDAIEALLSILGGQNEDALAALLRENVAIRQLTGDGLPEPEELYHLGLAAFLALRALRNQAAHSQAQVTPLALPWLLTLGDVPVAQRRRGEEPDVELLDATRRMLDPALEQARLVEGLLGKELIRLTQRLTLWTGIARTRAAGDFRLKVEHQFEDLAGTGAARLLIKLSLAGRASLSEFIARLDITGETLRVAEFAPGDSTALRVVLSRDLPWEAEADSLVLPCRLVWSARRVDGQPVDGTEALMLRRPRNELARDRSSSALGVSPYITGDVVEDAEMFVGRRAILDDIKTHIGGGTKVILLEGNRRTGKTSILRQLPRPDLGLRESWILVECSLQGTVGDATKDGIPTEGIFRLIVRDIGITCASSGFLVPLPEMEATADLNSFRFRFARALNGFFRDIDPYEALQIYVDMVTEAIGPRRLLLMLDEFDKVQVGIDNGVTSPQVPENIRNLLQTRPAVAAIITGSRRLKRLREEYWSALFGFGHRIGLDPLEPDEVRELVTRPVAGRLGFDDESVALIVQLTARQPYLVQSLCARVFELAKRHGWRRIRSGETLEAASRMVRDNEHFQALWSYAETERRRYLMCLCNRLAGGSQRVNAALLNESLDEAGITLPIERVDDDLKFLIELEVVAMANTPLGPQYELAIPLMRRWMELNVDAEAQRRKAVHEQQSQDTASNGIDHGSDAEASNRAGIRGDGRPQR